MPELHCGDRFSRSTAAQAEIVCAAALSHDGVEPLSEQAAALIWADPSATLLHAWVTDDGRLVGYGNVDARRIPTIECVVHPTARNQGSGEASAGTSRCCPPHQPQRYRHQYRQYGR
ncbi:MAG: hypothetical protein U1U88_001880 [Lawsonella clevelandensis]